MHQSDSSIDQEAPRLRKKQRGKLTGGRRDWSNSWLTASADRWTPEFKWAHLAQRQLEGNVTTRQGWITRKEKEHLVGTEGLCHMSASTLGNIYHNNKTFKTVYSSRKRQHGKLLSSQLREWKKKTLSVSYVLKFHTIYCTTTTDAILWDQRKVAHKCEVKESPCFYKQSGISSVLNIYIYIYKIILAGKLIKTILSEMYIFSHFSSATESGISQNQWRLKRWQRQKQEISHTIQIWAPSDQQSLRGWDDVRMWFRESEDLLVKECSAFMLPHFYNAKEFLQQQMGCVDINAQRETRAGKNAARSCETIKLCEYRICLFICCGDTIGCYWSENIKKINKPALCSPKMN